MTSIGCVIVVATTPDINPKDNLLVLEISFLTKYFLHKSNVKN